MNRQQKASDEISRHEETAYTFKLPGQMWPATEAWSVSVQTRHGVTHTLPLATLYNYLSKVVPVKASWTMEVWLH